MTNESCTVPVGRQARFPCVELVAPGADRRSFTVVKLPEMGFCHPHGPRMVKPWLSQQRVLVVSLSPRTSPVWHLDDRKASVVGAERAADGARCDTIGGVGNHAPAL